MFCVLVYYQSNYIPFMLLCHLLIFQHIFDSPTV